MTQSQRRPGRLARLLADLPIQGPRSIRTAEEIIAVRDEIEHKISVADRLGAGC